MAYRMRHKRTQKITELSQDEYNNYSSKQMFRNNFYFEKINTGESVVGVPINDLIEKQKAEKPKKAKKDSDKKDN